NIEIKQPPCRYLSLIKIINMGWERVGYLSTSADDIRVQLLQDCASKLDFKLVKNVITGDNSLPDATDRILRDSDILLALPDNIIYNRHSVKNILLSAYRHRIPVIGFSDNFVRAGALASVYSTPDQLAEQVVVTIRRYFDKDVSGINISIPPAHYSVSINSQVAKALDIDLKNKTQIEALMHQLEAAQ
ncbi:MAG: ABC transporter substrate binding protein, partial [Gammaproteobacteria bacterium]